MCLYLTTTCGDPNSPAALNAEMQTFILLRQHPFCPNSPTRTAPQAASPAQIALLIWQTQIPLPHPAPYIAPGYAVTGKRAYLEIHDNPSLPPQHFNQLGYDITVDAASTYDIIWGDGTQSTGITSAGGPYPNGNVSHVYDNTGNYTVRIVQTWHGRYTVNGLTGTIDSPLTTEGTIQGFPVHQIEAVKLRAPAGPAPPGRCQRR
ncbi:MAG: hypothetical protein E6G27_08070 [Actinobacteria bacterium]|nr:MAG: hypothetical protein E6G27_08070 [Actinomycetota bacterium]